MYRVIFETTLPDLFVALVKDEQIVWTRHLVDCREKSENLPQVFQELISENSLRADQIDRYYVTLGPGSFMGSRASLVLARSIALTTRSELWVANTFSFITNQSDGTYYLKASKTQSYLGKIQNGQLSCQLVRLCPSEPFDYYRAFFKHPGAVLSHFKKAEDLATLEPIYLKEPEAAVWKF